MMQVLWAIYLASYPIAVAGVAFDVRPGFSLAWAGSVLLFVQGSLAALALIISMGWRRGGLLALAILVGGYFVETIGVMTGFPFGHYRYTTILFPQLPGTVPLPVVCAWLVVAVTAVATARSIAPGKTPIQRWQQIGLATAFGVGFDLVLEPVAVHVQHYWIWQSTGPYYGIPFVNFLGWAALCAVLCTLLVWAGPTPAPDLQTAPSPFSQMEREISLQTDRVNARLISSGASPSPFVRMGRELGGGAIPVWLYVLTLGMFAVIDLTHGLGYAALFGIVIGGSLALRWCAAYHNSDKQC